MMKVPKRKINEIMREFDWGKVRRTMTALNWTYQGCTTVPTKAELKHTALNLFALLERPDHTVGTGGFQATWHEHGGVSLDFIVESWEVD
jgi:hypothetical protein